MQICLKAPPLSRDDLKRITSKIRNTFQINSHYFPVDVALEFVHLLADGYRYEVVTIEDMGDNHGLTHYNDRLIQIREDVYDGACNGVGRDRMTIAHEIGHAILHTDSLRSARDFGAIKRFEDPEWQAMAFAGHLLIPDTAIQIHDEAELTRICGVSNDAARVAVNTFKFSKK